MSSVSRHLPIAASGLVVLLAAMLAPVPAGNGEGGLKAEADSRLAAILTVPLGTVARLKPMPSPGPSAPEPVTKPSWATQGAAYLAAESEGAASAVREAPPQDSPPQDSPLAAIDKLTGEGDGLPVATPAAADMQVALATPYAEPDAPALRLLPQLLPPAPAVPEPTAPLADPLHASLEPGQMAPGQKLPGEGTQGQVPQVQVMPGDWDPALAPLPASIAPPDADKARPAIAAYRKGDMALGDAFAATVATETARAALEWVAIRTDSHGTGFRRITAFLKAHPDWPSALWLRRRSEEALYADKQGFALLASYFSKARPESAPGKLALARLARNQGRTEEAAALVREVWREGEFGHPLESKILEEFGDLLTVEDHKFRADRAFYKEDAGRLMRAAALAGVDELALAKAEAAVIDEAGNSEALLAALPAKLKTDPSFIFARIQLLRRTDKQDKLAEAAKLMVSAPRDPALIVDGDAWWVERRMIARKLLDASDAKPVAVKPVAGKPGDARPAGDGKSADQIWMAYEICAGHGAASAEMRIEAEFHAGWIALRFLDDPTLAAPHFAVAASIAAMPASIARAAYWQGRTAQALGDAGAAQSAYTQASAYATTYYGQLARAKLNLTDLPLRETRQLATGDERDLAIRVAEFLYAVGGSDFALPLVADVARRLTDEGQMAALGKVVENGRDAGAALVLGKIATQRGYALDDFAFPTFGVPYYQPVANSADKPIVYAIARQESAFAQTATSTAGAKGLMQLMPDTARRTAQHAGIALDMSKLNSDASLNARIGAAHLGELFAEQGGSYVLTFAAYNAGGKRVKEWIAAHGDPRHGNVDPVDWIERIPITETRDYVQRIIENMQVYRTRFGHASRPINEAELRRRGGG
ncbi:MAG: transglycosylase SLT domain-containing protein [Hyphomicrobiales bacterium]